jgi:H+/Cl- antiporter ClcA
MATETEEAPPQQRSAGSAYLRLVLIGAAIGIPAAFVSALFLALVHQLEHWLWPSSPGWYLVLFLPVAGAAIVLFARTRLPGDGGHQPIDGLSTNPTPVAHAPGIALAALGTLGFGAVLGPEAPVVALGSVVGVGAASLVRVGGQAAAVLSIAGSFSAIAALFGGPIVAGMLLVEGGLSKGTALLPALVPGVVAAAVGDLIFIGLGNWEGLAQPGLQVPGLPAYHGTHVRDLAIAIAVGIVIALALAQIGRAARAVLALRDRLGLAGLLFAGALAVGVLAEVGVLLGAESDEILFSGQAAVPEIVAEGSTGIILVVLVAKAAAYAVSLGCGFRGGPIFPAIFLGVGLATLPVVWFGASPTLAIAVGTSGAMAAQTRLLFAPAIFAALLVGSAGADATPAAVLASVAGYLTMTALDRRVSGGAPG